MAATRWIGWLRSGWRDWGVIAHGPNEAECRRRMDRVAIDPDEVDGARVVLPEGVHPTGRKADDEDCHGA